MSSEAPTLKVLLLVITHALDIFTIRELGRLSVSSKEIQKVFQETEVWKVLWTRAVEAGRQCGDKEGVPLREYTRMRWHNEEGLLPCFLDPHLEILEQVGYKHALGCLVSKSCRRCGKMAGNANPFTLTRLCSEDCNPITHSDDPTTWVICKTKAKDCFLLGEPE